MSRPVRGQAQPCGVGGCARLTTTPGWCGVPHASSVPTGMLSSHPKSSALAGYAAADPISGADGPVLGRVEGRLADQDLTGVDLRTTEWIRTPAVHRVRLDRADGRDARIGIGALFTVCSFQGLRASRAVVGGTHYFSDFSEADLSGARLPSVEEGSFAGADLSFADGHRQSFDGCDFGGADVGGAAFVLCSFRGADLRDLGMDDARWRDCVYDNRTRFPDGYDPAASSWRYGPLSAETAEMLDKMRRDALDGDVGELSRYR